MTVGLTPACARATLRDWKSMQEMAAISNIHIMVINIYVHENSTSKVCLVYLQYPAESVK
jgi:hypothetical protein